MRFLLLPYLVKYLLNALMASVCDVKFYCRQRHVKIARMCGLKGIKGGDGNIATNAFIVLSAGIS